MKTFIASVIIFLMLCGSIFASSLFTSKELDTLYRAVSVLPADISSFEKEKDNMRHDIEELFSDWGKSIDRLAYTMSYDMLDRADDALLTLYSSYFSDNAEDFVLARLKFLDCLKRLSVLSSFSLKSFT
ncbi:MAG: hypothetical protein ACI4QR_02035 [Eubacteriales bacterium]